MPYLATINVFSLIAFKKYKTDFIPYVYYKTYCNIVEDIAQFLKQITTRK